MTDLSSENIFVFLSYATPDRERVDKYYDFIQQSGYDVWMDHRHIKAGQSWDYEIKKAFFAAAVIVVFISNNSTNKRGYVQKEIRLAVEKLEEILQDDIYVIPVILDDDASIPEVLKSYQYIKDSDAECRSRLIDSISTQLSKFSVKGKFISLADNLSWSIRKYKDSYHAFPGYEIECEFISFRSSYYNNISEVSDSINGEINSHIFECRKSIFEQDIEIYNFGQDRNRRMNTFSNSNFDVKLVGRILSVSFGAYQYHAGAAHGMHWKETFSYFLDPLFHFNYLEFIFEESKEDSAFEVIQQESRRLIVDYIKLLCSEDENSDYEFEEIEIDMINNGIDGWTSFKNFTFSNVGIVIEFPPYQVAAYAYGVISITIEYKLIFKFMKKAFITALELEHLEYQEINSYS